MKRKKNKIKKSIKYKATVMKKKLNPEIIKSKKALELGVF
jgi:hypothetical protein